MDMYLPALPEVTDALHAPAATVQLTLTACLLGMALGQLVVGPMSDRWGRRRPLLVGLVVYVVATALCAFAPDRRAPRRLPAGRRASRARPGIVIARAVVRDLYDGVAMARFFSTLMLISGVAPIVAPADRRADPAVHRLAGRLRRPHRHRRRCSPPVVWARLPETLPPAERHSGGVGEALRTDAPAARRPRLHRLHARRRLRLRRALRLRLGLARS